MKRKRPRLELFASKNAAIVYAAIDVLDPSEQVSVLLHLQALLEPHAPLTADARAKAGWRAVSRAYELLDDVAPSVKKYDLVRRLHPEEGLPPVTTVKRWLGGLSWDAILRELGMEPEQRASEDLAPEFGLRLTQADALAAANHVVKELGHVPSFAEYSQFVHRPDIKHLRYPKARDTFVRLFDGGFHACFVAAGFLAPGEIPTRPDGRVYTRVHTFTDDECLSFLHEVVARLGHPPTSGEFPVAREAILADAASTGHNRVAPSIQTLFRRFGPGWDQVLKAGGYPSDPRRRRNGRERPVFTDELILNALKGARDVLGARFSRQRYEGWRDRELTRDPARTRDLPASSVLSQRFGNWGGVHRVVEEMT